MSETINHPAHYGGESSPYEVIKLIESWGLGFHLGNTLKYVARAGKKTPGDVVTDLKKARWYLERAVKSPSIQTHVRLCTVKSGDYTSTALAAVQVWGLDLNLTNVVVMIANAATRDMDHDTRADLRLALENLDKALAHWSPTA